MEKLIRSSFNILAVIPARGGSKGVVGKNLRHIGGKPLFAQIATTAQKVKLINKVIVSTEDKKILGIAKKYGIETPFVRPRELADDTSQLSQVIYHAYQFYIEKGKKYDAILSLQPTAPFLSSESIEKAIQIMISSDCESVCSIAEFTRGHPYIAKTLSENDILLPFCPTCSINAKHIKRRQDRKKAFYVTGGLYLRSSKLLSRGNPSGHWLGSNTKAVVLSEIEAMDINSELDFKIAELLCCHMN